MSMRTQTEPLITWRALLTGVVVAGVFAWLESFFAGQRGMDLTSTQIPVLPYALLFLTVLLINPFIRLIRVVRRFSVAEIMTVFTMGLVSSGIATFGLTLQLLPMAGSLFNPAWNTRQTQWDRTVAPCLNADYFLSVDGLGEALDAQAAALSAQERLQKIVDAAARLEASEKQLREADAAVAAQEAENGTAEKALAVANARQRRQTALEQRERMRRTWESMWAGQSGVPSPAQAQIEYGERLKAAEAATAAIVAKVEALEKEAFARVELFRRGLPRDQRAYPGFLMLPEDTVGSYLARCRRTWYGRQIGNELSGLLGRLQTDPAAVAAPDGLRDAASILDTASRQFEQLGDAPALRRELEKVRGRHDELAASIADLEADLRRRNDDRRVALRAAQAAMDREIARRQARCRSLQRHLKRLASDRDFLQRQVELVQGVAQPMAEVVALRDAVKAGRLPADAAETLRRVLERLPSLDGSLERYLIGDIPWSHWAGLLGRWALVIGLTYVVLMTFNVLIFRQWAHNEKLIYPLAELPEILVGSKDADGGVPSVFRSGLFWAGFTLVALVLGYNLLTYTELVPGLVRLNLTNDWRPYIRNSPLQGLVSVWDPIFARSEVFFTMIGLAFLIPTKVSFSLWFFTVLSMVQMLIMVAAGYGQNEDSFPHDWWYALYFRTAEGGGAMLVFASVVLFKCRKYLLCAFTPSQLAGLEADEVRELRVSSFLFVVASLGVILMVWLSMGANLVYTLVAYFAILVTTIGLVRAVTEGGLLGFQCWVNPLHFVRAFFGLDRTWTAAPMFAPIMVYYSALFMDIKTFIAPAMANSLKIRDDLRMQRGRFHLGIALAIAIAAVVSILMTLMMSYDRGADVMSGWFFTGFPKWLFGTIDTCVKTPPVAAPGDGGWILAGGGAMAALLYFRQTLFWLPHPIGMIMLVNPIMGAYWFSILLGWLCKSLVTRYGNNQSYVRARAFFIGLIVGELLIVALGMVVSYCTGVGVGINLNRN